MFTGLVRETGTVSEICPLGYGISLTFLLPTLGPTCAIGDSIAINGVCLTVVNRVGDLVRFEVSPETIAKTNLGLLAINDKVNAEPSLRIGDVLGGHLVQGHVDSLGELISRNLEGGWEIFSFSMPNEAAKFVAPKGSITVNGVSLTVVDASFDRFTVALIPHTLKETNLGIMNPGAKVNLETDMLARYVQRILSFSYQNNNI